MGRPKKKRIYLDAAASTSVDARVSRAMRPYFAERFGNPGAIHKEGVEAAEAVAAARGRIARLLQMSDDSVIFTGSGTEANNLALIGLVEALREGGRPYRDMEIVTSAIEHPSILEPARYLKRRGVRLVEVRPEGDGRVDPRRVARALSRRSVLVSIGYVNSEIGTVAPLREIARVLRKARALRGSPLPYFHTDACQAGAYLPLAAPALGVDLMTLDAQKIRGPKGVGLLMRRRGVPLSPLIRGGGQEAGLRSGTENVAGIVGFAEALALAQSEQGRAAKKVSALRDAGIELLLKRLPGAILNGSREYRVPNNINISVPGLDGELMVLALDAAGMAAGTKSACERESGPSHVLAAIGRSEEAAASSLRLTLTGDATRADLARVAEVLRALRARQERVGAERPRRPSSLTVRRRRHTLQGT